MLVDAEHVERFAGDGLVDEAFGLHFAVIAHAP
jgi:hypothetical protein